MCLLVKGFMSLSVQMGKSKVCVSAFESLTSLSGQQAISPIFNAGIVGRIYPKTLAAMEVFLQSIAIEDHESMASDLINMGATGKDVDSKAFASDLEKIFLSIQDLDIEIIVAATNATAVAANVVFDERQMNALFGDVVKQF
uniref:Uncharacterized aarF domain-containing protein kinase At5g05200, chloroplastic-like isoform X1 n=2 Tax=Nicotiana sylvestris TaxID=4096 RepID=A0A1U7V961_NICSY|nr:PREDICTED: uncharacterized aarF domain-containing protein kinase At5g05200, chloroplastic-like isoform X1 [Nicotiana sylvestris]